MLWVLPWGRPFQRAVRSRELEKVTGLAGLTVSSCIEVSVSQLMLPASRHYTTYFGQVKDLDPVRSSLAPDHNPVLVPAQLAPDGRGRVLRQTPKVYELALGSDLREAGAIRLGYDGELASIRARPAPGRRSLPSTTAKGCVTLEVVEVDLGAVRSTFT